MPYLKKFPCLSILFLLTCSSQALAQWEWPFLTEYFFSRTPGARMEAMGKTYAPTESDVTCVFKNPAGVSNIKGAALDFAYSSPYYLVKDGKYLFLGGGFTFNKYISIAAVVNRFDYGSQFLTDNAGNFIAEASPSETNYSFSFASQPFKNINIGVTLNYFDAYFPPVHSNGIFYPDIGALKYFDIGKNKKIKHKIFVGQAFSNFTKSKISFETNGETTKSELPFISRTGIGYNLITADSAGEKFLKSQEATFSFEYEEVLNSKYVTSFRFGIEFKLFTILSLRTGYYRQKVSDFGNPEYNKSEISDFTYGIGVSVPFVLLTKNKIPLTIKLDFANMRQTPYTHEQATDLDRFNSISLSLNYAFKKTKM